MKDLKHNQNFKHWKLDLYDLHLWRVQSFNKKEMHAYFTRFIKVLVRRVFMLIRFIFFILFYLFTRSPQVFILHCSFPPGVFLTSCYLHVLLLHNLGYISKLLEVVYLTFAAWFKLFWHGTHSSLGFFTNSYLKWWLRV